MSPTPPDLAIGRTEKSWPYARVVILGLAQALGLTVATWLLPGVRVRDWAISIVVVVVLAVINAVVWPIAVRLTLPLITWTVGLFTFVLNAVLISLVAWLIDGFEVDSFWSALAVAFVFAVINVAVGGVLSVDDEHVWRQHAVRRLVRQRGDVHADTSAPGFLFIQIDGLGHDVLERAMADGHAPMLAGLVEQGTHRLIGWECDLSSQTGAMQAGILLGDNSNMPAFRWYEKDTAKVMVSNRPKDAAEIERRQSSGQGLLADGGASRANVFSGDAPDSMLTFSTVLESSRGSSPISYVVATPYTFLRMIAMSLADIARELVAARRARKAGVEPIMHRGGVYPLLRAATNVVLSEMTIAMLIADVERGVPSMYADFVGYDEVAHHSGIAAPESLDTLRRTDEHLRRLLAVVAEAPRDYFIVVLSDHGQTQGSTFLQRYGLTLDELVRNLADDAAVSAPLLAGESWNNVNGMLSDAAAEPSTMGRTVARLTKNHADHGEVEFGPATATEDHDGDVIVLASGNLGLLSFAAIEGRADRQSIDARYPALIDGLVAHQGIGWVLVRDREHGDVVIGADGFRRLDDDAVVGADPLEPFGPNAAMHLRRTSSFDNCPDVLVNSFYDPVTDEGAAFEELIGFHGGMGGAQSHPFVLAPAQFSAPGRPLVGAESLHGLFTSWLREVAPSDD